MTNDTIKRIFNDKEHFTTAGTNKEHGSGLGLNLCKELVKHNNGFISVKSEVGTGSIFTVHFRSNTATS
jgi:signal transduction histidine kinase